MIELSENTRGIWFVSWRDADWMAGVWQGPTGLIGAYRFRYYADDRADRKSWCDLKPTGSPDLIEHPDALVHAVSEMSRLIETAQMGAQRWELLRGTSTLEQFLAQMQTLPFAHSRTMSPEQFEREYGRELKQQVCR